MTDAELFEKLGEKLNKLSQRFCHGTFLVSAWNAKNAEQANQYLRYLFAAGITDAQRVLEDVPNLLFLRAYRLHAGNIYLATLFRPAALDAVIKRLQERPDDPYLPAEKFIWNYVPESVKLGAPEGATYFFQYSYEEIRNFAHAQNFQAAARHFYKYYRDGGIMPSAHMLQVVDRMFFCLLGNNFMQESSGRPDERLMVSDEELLNWLAFHNYLKEAVKRQEAKNLLELFGYFDTEKKIGKAAFKLCELLWIQSNIQAGNQAIINEAMNLVRADYVKNSVATLARRVDDAINELRGQVAETDWAVFGPLLLETERPLIRRGFGFGG